MIADHEVVELYRCLLGRAPEAPGTITAFQNYYPDFAQGRLAVLGSDEFSRLLNAQTGRVTAELTRRFLQRAGGAAQLESGHAQPGLADAMRMMIRAHGAIRLAVVVGQDGPGLADLLPLENAQAAMLHVAPEFPAFLPQIAKLPAGGTLFRIAFEPAALAAFLRQAELRIDLLALLGAPAEWWDALLPCLSDRAMLAAGAQSVLPDWPDLETPLQLDGVAVVHRGGWFLPVCYRPPQARAETASVIPNLAIAAIVRNERHAVVNMLRSTAPIAGCFVVLDTGSSDDTYDCAEDFLKSSGTPFVLARGQPGRFDAMRNAALDLVPDSADWVLMLDADEELCAEDREALRALLAAADRDAYALPRYNYRGADKTGDVAPYPDRQVRLFRNRPDDPIRYDGAVHETVRNVPAYRLPCDAGALGQGEGGPHIHHLVRRFRSPEAEDLKQQHYRRIAAEHAGQECAAGDP
jgi:hypothetical protein